MVVLIGENSVVPMVKQKGKYRSLFTQQLEAMSAAELVCKGIGDRKRGFV